MSTMCLRGLLIVLAFVGALGVSAMANAHFNLNMNVRIFHVEHTDKGLRVYLRTPMPYLVADKIGPAGADGLPEAAPFTTNRREEEGVMYLVDEAALRADPLGLGRIAADGLRLKTGGVVLQPAVMKVRAYPLGRETGFATLDEIGPE